MTGRALELVAQADYQARDLLMNSYDMTPGFGAIQDWAQAIRSATGAWRVIPDTVAWQTSSGAVGDPFTTAAITATHIETDATALSAHARRTQHAVGIHDLLNQAATEIIRDLPDTIRPTAAQQHEAAKLRTGLLHVSYVLTHATGNTVTRQAAVLAREQSELSKQTELLAARIRGIEQTLDAHLHQPSASSRPVSEAGSLDRAVDRFLFAAYRSQPGIDAAGGVVLADIGRSLVGHTARLAIESAQQGLVPVTDVRERLLPALQASIREWEASRTIWSRMLAPTDRPTDDITAAGIHLQRVLQDPTLAQRPGITTSMTRILTAGTELAVLNQRALADPDRTAPAGVVAALTAEALAERPNMGDPMRIWLSVERVDGPAPIRPPHIVRDRLITQGQATLDAAVQARSAGHSFTGHTGQNSLLQLHEGTTRRARRPPAETLSPNRANHPAPRIG